jgi:hypothetical protein
MGLRLRMAVLAIEYPHRKWLIVNHREDFIGPARSRAQHTQ